MQRERGRHYHVTEPRRNRRDQRNEVPESRRRATSAWSTRRREGHVHGDEQQVAPAAGYVGSGLRSLSPFRSAYAVTPAQRCVPCLRASRRPRSTRSAWSCGSELMKRPGRDQGPPAQSPPQRGDQYDGVLPATDTAPAGRGWAAGRRGRSACSSRPGAAPGRCARVRTPTSPPADQVEEPAASCRWCRARRGCPTVVTPAEQVEAGVQRDQPPRRRCRCRSPGRPGSSRGAPVAHRPVRRPRLDGLLQLGDHRGEKNCCGTARPSRRTP